MQQMWGFKAGETVIRGAFEGKVFRGEVLLKIRPNAPEECRDVQAYWAPIELRLSGDTKLYGAWLQTYMDESKSCKVVAEKWQLYGLEKLQLN